MTPSFRRGCVVDVLRNKTDAAVCPRMLRERPRAVVGVIALAVVTGHLTALRAIVRSIRDYPEDIRRWVLRKATHRPDVHALLQAVAACPVNAAVAAGEPRRALELMRGGLDPRSDGGPIVAALDTHALLAAASRFAPHTIALRMWLARHVVGRHFGADVASVIWGFVAVRSHWGEKKGDVVEKEGGCDGSGASRGNCSCSPRTRRRAR